MKLKTINLIGNILLALNLIAGLLWLHWAVVIVFAVLHTLVRLQYLKAEQQLQAQNADTTQTSIAPPMIRNVASVISAVIMAGLIYAVGYGIRYGANLMMG
ncbi:MULTISPECIES: hypothetical protein [unclassified Moraxella]|uniref:hypothetical protein n=1 Tax=unclassified Moraxella TaxID=2685852 RepID=UPI003AF4B696